MCGQRLTEREASGIRCVWRGGRLESRFGDALRLQLAVVVLHYERERAKFMNGLPAAPPPSGQTKQFLPKHRNQNKALSKKPKFRTKPKFWLNYFFGQKSLFRPKYFTLAILRPKAKAKPVLTETKPKRFRLDTTIARPTSLTDWLHSPLGWAAASVASIFVVVETTI